MALKGIIFDLDGTLADTLPICIRAYQHVLRKHLARDFLPAEITAMFGLPEEGILAKCVPLNPQAALEDYLAEYTRLHETVSEPFPGILDALERLRERGLLLGIVTGKGPHSARISMRLLGLEDCIDPVITGDSRKPSKTEDMLQVLQSWQIEPHEAIYVGDTPEDMHSAKRAGVQPAGAAWAATATVQPGGLNGSAPVFKTVAALMEWIEQQLI